KWTVHGRLFPTTRSTTWSRPMVALTSVLRDRWVRTRALYSASFCRRKADGSADFARKRSDNMIDPAEANETYRAASAIAAFDAIQVAPRPRPPPGGRGLFPFA